MLNAPSTSAGLANPRRITVGKFSESPSQMSLRLLKASNCCSESMRSWREFGDLARNIASLPELKFYELIPALAKNIVSINNVAKEIRIDEYIRKMRFDGSIDHLWEHGISGEDINSGECIRNGKKVEQIVPLLDRNDVPGAAKDFLCHFYLKLALSKLAQEKTLNAFRLHTVVHRDYNADNNGAYPLLKPDGAAYRIRTIASWSSISETGRFYPCRPVKPFISSTLTAEQRGKLYDPLEVRLLGSKDLAANERSLVGQRGVFSAREITCGTCIGVQAGPVFTWENLARDCGISIDGITRMINMNYLVDLSVRRGSVDGFFLDGNNIISKINSCFFREGGENWRQADGGYNVEVAGFRCELDDKQRIDLAAVFAVCDIRSGEELRMNYHYPPELVAQVMNTEKIVGAANKEDLVRSILRLTIHDPGQAPGESLH
jgi:hypothetical protein